jgi:hypothetical protein
METTFVLVFDQKAVGRSACDYGIFIGCSNEVVGRHSLTLPASGDGAKKQVRRHNELLA